MFDNALLAAGSCLNMADAIMKDQVIEKGEIDEGDWKKIVGKKWFCNNSTTGSSCSFRDGLWFLLF